MMMAEGPHGPNGEITADPTLARIIPIVLLVALALIVCGIVLLGRGRD